VREATLTSFLESVNVGTEGKDDEAQGQRKATKNSSEQIQRGGGEAKHKRSYVRSESGALPTHFDFLVA
jgi:hypothetical protein